MRQGEDARLTVTLQLFELSCSRFGLLVNFLENSVWQFNPPGGPDDGCGPRTQTAVRWREKGGEKGREKGRKKGGEKGGGKGRERKNMREGVDEKMHGIARENRQR
jgi:hypothetical protein